MPTEGAKLWKIKTKRRLAKSCLSRSSNGFVEKSTWEVSKEQHRRQGHRHSLHRYSSDSTFTRLRSSVCVLVHFFKKGLKRQRIIRKFPKCYLWLLGYILPTTFFCAYPAFPKENEITLYQNFDFSSCSFMRDCSPSSPEALPPALRMAAWDSVKMLLLLLLPFFFF